DLGHRRDAAALDDQLRDVGIGIAQVAEVPRARGAGLHAGGHALGFVQVFVVDAVDAEGALLHHPVDLRVLARAVGAGPAAELAADALVRVDQHDAVLGALVAGAGGADGDAGGGVAVEAAAGEVERHRGLFRGLAPVRPAGTVRGRRGTGRGDLVAVHAVEPDPGGLLPVG